MLAFTVGAFAVASFIVFGAILPAEFNWDPRARRITGFSRLGRGEVAFDNSASVPLAREYAAGFTDTIEIPMSPEGDRSGDEQTLKVRMAKNATPCLNGACRYSGAGGVFPSSTDTP
jgi:hypothetical protein